MSVTFLFFFFVFLGKIATEITGNKYVSPEAHQRLQYTLRFHNQPETLKKLLRDIQRNSPSYTVIDCADCSSGDLVTDLQVDYICEALVKNDYVQVLKLGHNHISLTGALTLIETLRSCPAVTTVSVRNNVLEGSGVAKAFAELLKDPVSSNLTSLDLAYNDLDDAAALCLLEALEVNDTLLYLDFRGNGISHETMQEVHRAVSLNSELDVKRVMPSVRANDPNVTVVDLSNRNTTDATVYTTCSALSENTYVTHLDLSHNKLVTDASCINYLAPLLTAESTKLQELSLARTAITSVGAACLLESLKNNTHLQVLNLSGTDLAPPSGTIVEAAADAFAANTTLLRLELENTGLSPAEITGITGKNMNGQPGLRKELPRVWRSDPELSVLDLSGSGAHNNTTCYLLAEALLANTTLTDLSLSQTKAIDDIGVNYLARALHQNLTLTALHVRNCSVGDEGASSLAAALRVNRALAFLDLSHNQIGNSGCQDLINSLRADIYGNNTVRAIDLQGNRNIREDLVTELSIQLSLNNGPSWLKEDLLALRDNGVTELRYSGTNFSDQYVALLVQAMQGNTSVTVVDLSNCLLEADGGELISSLIRANSTITHLNLSHNKIGVSASALAKALHHNAHITELDIAHNDCNAYDEDRVQQLVDLNKYPKALKIAVLASLERDPTQIVVDVSGGIADDSNSDITKLNDAGVAILSETLKTDTYTEVIDLSHNSLTCASASPLCVMLKINDSIVRIDLSYNAISDEGVAEFAGLLSTHNSLNSIDLGYNRITEKGAALLLEAIEMNYGLHKVVLAGNTAISQATLTIVRILQALNHTDKAFCSAFQKVVLGAPTKEVSLEGWLGLGYYNTDSLDLVVEAVSMNEAVETLDLSFCDVRDGQVPLLAGLLKQAPHLKSLKLPNNFIKHNLAPLTNVLATNTTLLLLDLRDNNVNLTGAKLLAAMLRKNDYLTELDISGNDLTDIGVTIIIEAVKMNDALQALWCEAPVWIMGVEGGGGEFNKRLCKRRFSLSIPFFMGWWGGSLYQKMLCFINYLNFSTYYLLRQMHSPHRASPKHSCRTSNLRWTYRTSRWYVVRTIMCAFHHNLSLFVFIVFIALLFAAVGGVGDL